jgi:serine/threonine protein kinase
MAVRRQARPVAQGLIRWFNDGWLGAVVRIQRGIEPVGEANTVLGRYELRAIIARGASSTVYEGWDTGITRRVAIKTISLPEATDPELQDMLGRFRREARAAGALQHPNIVGVYDYGETASLAYIVMEFIDGPTLKSLLDRKHQFAFRDIVRIMQDVLAGLQYSHDRGIVHRDIKPANLMLTPEGRIKIADFGIARIESSEMTQVGTVMGTPAYMSPEQFAAETVDLRTDIYSAGVVLYQLLTGERPFEGSATTIMHKVLHAEPPKPSQKSALCTPSLDAVVARAMAKNRDQRYDSAEAFGRALGKAVDTPINVRRTAPVSAPKPIIRPPGRPRLARRLKVARPFAIVVIGMFMLTLAGAGVWVSTTEWSVRHTDQGTVPTPAAPPPKVEAPKTAEAPPQAPLLAPPAPAPASTQSQPAQPTQVAPSSAEIEKPGPAPQNSPDQAPPLLGDLSPGPTQPPPVPFVPPPAPEPGPPRSPPHAHPAPPPSDPVEQLIERLRKGEQARPAPSDEPTEPGPVPKATGQTGNWVGLYLKPVTSETLRPIGGSGLVVTAVDASSAAAQKGVKPGDVVLSYNDRPVRSVIAFNRAAASTPMGQLVSIDIWRDDQVTEVEITRADQPTKDDQ